MPDDKLLVSNQVNLHSQSHRIFFEQKLRAEFYFLPQNLLKLCKQVGRCACKYYNLFQYATIAIAKQRLLPFYLHLSSPAHAPPHHHHHIITLVILHTTARNDVK